jgi:hypothetical protein
MTGAVFFEINASHLTVRFDREELELSLQRDDSGVITLSCRAHLVTAIKESLIKHQIRSGGRALCAIDGRGVSLRRLGLPPAPKEEFQRLLLLQLEREFPLPPEQLAWGSRVLRQDAAKQEVLVAAIRKEMLQPFIEIFSDCGIHPDFTVAALWRAAHLQPPEGPCALLHVGRKHSELLIYEDGFPAALRVLNWGRDNLSAATATDINVPKIYLTDAESAVLPPNLAGIPCVQLQPAVSSNAPPLILRCKEAPGRVTYSDVRSRKPLVLAASLLCAVLAFPFLQALVLKPYLSHRISTLKGGIDRLGAIDREIDFLQYLRASQAPYMETLFLMAKAAPPGTSFDSVSIGRRGDIAMRGKLGNAQQVTDFRSKLIEAGWFSSVVVQEQTPTPDRRVTVRMTAQLKDAGDRKPLPEEKPHK